MKLFVYITIGILLAWMLYVMIFQKEISLDEQQKILKEFEKDDKWHYYKLKLKIFIFYIIGALLLLVILSGARIP